ncbi:imidazole glycerol phosphate synthase subunit HisH [Paracnuella aquatica]|uniref:imidazole glycerol phosphate synthase subunit HisH n=1 Tax=Paracnuella aquatica TaxID=2268757 RepID=UPI000DF017D0|nr:imidazole glycerol phosphate synthase subunit HisH [Paracnuella aquatica]RPD51021.1 imidazole glycerol phosphate synthase subunit HisH [Paracnuella aquatica]
MITIIDYGMGNLGSIQNMFKRIKVASEVTSDLKKISQAKKILLPGVGAFDAAMERIENAGFLPVLNQKALEEKIPILGICLGMQLLTNSSEEGVRRGLGWINAKTIRFKLSDARLKVPHMGWNLVHTQNLSPLIDNLPEDPRFYFVHSYHVQCMDPFNVLTTTHYGISFHSVIQQNNIYGAQFHPEKSHKFGMKLLQNFAQL